MPRLCFNRITAFVLGLALGAGLVGGAAAFAANRSRSGLAGELQRRIEAERRAREELASIIDESGHILDRMEKSLGSTAEGVSGAAGRLRIYAKEAAALEALVDRYRSGSLHSGHGNRPAD